MSTMYKLWIFKMWLIMSKLKTKYFVLKPEGDDIYAKASRKAMETYAKAIKEGDPEFSEEILEWIGKDFNYYEDSITPKIPSGTDGRPIAPSNDSGGGERC